MGNHNSRDGILPNQTILDMPSSTFADRRPLLFHTVRGENVQLSKGCRVARRVESFCKGVAFSDRPVAVEEVVCLRFSEIAKNWSGVLRFGLTNTDPATLAGSLPKFACPDLTNKEGNWAKAIAERYCQQGSILHFYVRENGDLFYGVNGVQKGLFLSSINTRKPLYVMLDIYDPNEVGSLRGRTGGGGDTIGGGHGPSSSQSTPARSISTNTGPTGGQQHPYLPSSNQQNQFNNHSNSQSQPDVSHIAQDFNRLSIPTPPSSSSTTTAAQPTTNLSSRFHAGVNFRPCLLHTVCGSNVTLNSQKTIASRLETEYSNGYVFTQRPIRIGEKIVIHILSTVPDYSGGLAFGVTACDPIHLRPESLPSDSDLLLDRKEYWVVAKDVATKPRIGDELAFYIGTHGEIFYYKNNSPARVIMHIDHTQSLWLFFDVYGNTQRIQILGIADVESRSRRSTNNSSTGGHHEQQNVTNNSSSTIQRQNNHNNTRDLIHFDSPLQLSSSSTNQQQQQRSNSLSSQQLRVNLPPPSSSSASTTSPNNQRPHIQPPRRQVGSSSTAVPPPPPRPPILSRTTTTSSSGATSSAAAATTTSTPYRPPPPIPRQPFPQPQQQQQQSFPKGDGGDGDGIVDNECNICMSESVDCVLYTCGHMCMCYGCAVEVRNKSGECPICRQVILDVIKTYKT